MEFQENVTTRTKPSHLCITRFCRRQRGKRSPLCGRCAMRQWRAANPMKYRLTVLRQRARRKGVPFDLTLEWLTEFLIVGGYDPTEHHIDRIRTWEGYTIGNLQILPMSENIAKGNRERYGKMEMPF